MSRSPAETPKRIEPSTPPDISKTGPAHRGSNEVPIDTLILQDWEMRSTYLADTLAYIEAGGEIPLALRNELLNTLQKLDIAQEDSSRSYPPLQTYVHNEPMNTGGEVRALKVLTMLKNGYEISPQIRKRLMDALRRM